MNARLIGNLLARNSFASKLYSGAQQQSTFQISLCKLKLAKILGISNADTGQ